MNVVNQVILLENVACALAHVAWEVDGIGALVPIGVGALVPIDVGGVLAMDMGAGVIVPVGEDLHDAGA